LVKALIRRRTRRCAALLGKIELAIFPLVGLRRFTPVNPRKSHPSVNVVMRVLSRLSVNAMRVAMASNVWSACDALWRQTRMVSRVKEWLSDRRQGLAVAAGFPLAVPH
jgi:hypothetical protein